MAQLEEQAAILMAGRTDGARARLEGLVRQQLPRTGREVRHYVVASLMARLAARAPPHQRADWARIHAAYPPFDAGRNF